MSILLRRLVPVPLIVALVFGSTVARAEDAAAAAAREHYQKATSYYDLGKYPEAIKEFEAAYEIKNDPALLYNLAQSNRLAGNADQALHFYRTYLRYVPHPANRVEIDDRIKQLEILLQQKNATQVTPPNQPSPPGATTPPPSAEPAPTPAPLPVEPLAAGAETVTESSGNLPMPASENRDEPQSGVSLPTTAQTEHAHLLKKCGWITAAVGGGLFLIGALEGASAVAAANQINDTAQKGGTYDPSVQQRGQSAQTAEAVFMITGVAAAGVGGALYLYGRSQERVSVVPVASQDHFGAIVSATF